MAVRIVGVTIRRQTARRDGTNREGEGGPECPAVFVWVSHVTIDLKRLCQLGDQQEDVVCSLRWETPNDPPMG